MPEVVNVYSETQNMVELKPYMKVYYVHTWIISSEEFGNLIKIAQTVSWSKSPRNSIFPFNNRL